MLDENVKELVAIGASVSANCHPCIKNHVAKAREMKIDEGEIRQAVEIGQMVRKALPAKWTSCLRNCHYRLRGVL